MYATREGKRCVIYIRVSSERQVKGYSIDGQLRYLREWAERQGMTVVEVYIEEGKSGKSIDGRTKFQTMLDDIRTKKYNNDYVIVYKLSRFGRNARDVLNSLEFIMKYGVHLLCVEDGLDSSTSMGKMMITILGAVAELERENIIAQTLLGREEKAKSGGWNGGFAPYGYKVLKEDGDSKSGRLIVDESKREAVQIIFDKFLYERIGYNSIAYYLNTHGFVREPAPNNPDPKFDDWTAEQVKRILDNPVYCGRVAWGRRRTEKVEGKDNEYRLVKQDNYILSDDLAHEGYVTEEEYAKIQELRGLEKKKGNQNIGQDKAHLLSGIAKCPMCGSSMYIAANRWTNKNGEKRETFTYICGHYLKARGTKYCKRNGISADSLEQEVIEYTSRLMHNPKFAEDIKERISKQIDLTELQTELYLLEDRLKKQQRNKASLEKDIDGLLVEDKYAERKREEYNRRLDALYEEIYLTEDDIEACKMKILSIEENHMNIKMIYRLLYNFDKLYAKMNDRERRDVIKALIKEVTLYTKEEQKIQRHLVKEITYSFPIDREIMENLRNQETHVETVVSLLRVKPRQIITVKMPVELEEVTEKATYKKIQEYVEKKYGFKVHSAYIAEVKRMHGLDMHEAPNKVEQRKHEYYSCPPEKVKAIEDALRHFGIIE